jgi:hypothetical protein
MAIEIIRGNQTKPVAYLSNDGCCAVYWPGKDGKCLRSDGTEISMDYSFTNFDRCVPLYKGDTIRVTRDIVL